MDLKEESFLSRDPATHWYYASKAKAAQKLLEPTRVAEILDVGAGSGVFSRIFVERGLAAAATCVDTGYSEDRTEQTKGGPIHFRRSVEGVPQRLVLFMDVLEHIDDDVAFLRSYADRMAPGTTVLITVPAFQWLWSDHDDFLEHRRRYTVGMVQDLVDKVGLRVRKLRYFFGLLFPAFVAVRLAKRVGRPSGTVAQKSDMADYTDWLNNLLIKVHDVERVLLLPVNRLCGLSVVCVAEKP